MRLPTQNETVWFWVVDDDKSYMKCMVHDMRGIHMGWHSGTRWHSYFDGRIAQDDSKVKAWKPLNVGQPGENWQTDGWQIASAV